MWLVLYGSVTGKAESIARLILDEAKSRRFAALELKRMDVAVQEGLLEDSSLTQGLNMIIVSSTTGDGEQPENARLFVRRLRQLARSKASRRSINFAILGLGDSNYNQFCNGPKEIHRLLQEWGAKQFYNPGWADDGVGLELVVEPWIEGLWTPLEGAMSRQPDSMGDAKEAPSLQPAEPPPLDQGSGSRRDLLDELEESFKTALTFDRISKRLADVVADAAAGSWGEISSSTSCPDPLTSLAFPEDAPLTLPSLPTPFLALERVEVVDLRSTPDLITPPHLQGKKPELLEVANTLVITTGSEIEPVYQSTLLLNEAGDLCSSLVPGDAIDLVCENPEAEVDTLLELLGFDPRAASGLGVRISALPGSKKPSKVPEHLAANPETMPGCLTLKQILKSCVEIRSVPKKPFLRLLADFSSGAMDRRRLEELCSRQGSNEYLKVVRGNNICLLDVLLAFPSCKPPLERVLEHLPALQPRPYSVARLPPKIGYPSGRPSQTVDLVFRLVKVPQGCGRRFPRSGISTGTLVASKAPFKLLAFRRIKKPFFDCCDDVKGPKIMIATGTGIAPMVSCILQTREELLDRRKNVEPKLGSDEPVDPFSWLIYGCRKSKADFIYEEELHECLKAGALDRLDVAFSREAAETKRYVQDVLREQEELLCSLIMEKKACVFLCGNANKMAKSVKEAIEQCLASRLGSLEAGRSELASMIVRGQYRQEVWG